MKTHEQKTDGKWRFAIDRGGTFTDIIGISPDGNFEIAKVLSESDVYDDAGIEGIRQILNLPVRSPLPHDEIAWIRIGTTVATNALLERKGTPTGLLITSGFRDILEIGTQDRPDIFALAIKKPDIIYKSVIEVDERTGPNGEIIKPIDMGSLKNALSQLKKENIESIAIVFLFSWKNPEHERIAKTEALKVGFTHVSTSHETMPLIKVVGRGRTTLVDSYLTPILAKYAESIRGKTGSIPLYFMSSSGGLLASSSFTGKDAILSGPSGGALGVESIAKIAGEKAVIGFDMGGTSTDVCRWSGSLERILDVETGGVRFTTPMLAVKTIAAGGGSILRFDGRKLTVGPDSSGANPGPACYGHGGPASLTDANLVLGRLQPKYFPNVFGHNRDRPLDISESIQRMKDIAGEIEKSQGIKMTVEELALGFIRIANEVMSRPIKELSIARGHDPRFHTLICFGGAGAQHACGIAKALGIRKILVPPLASLLSAFGILLAPHRRTRIETFLAPLNNDSLMLAERRAMEIKRDIESVISDEGNLPENRELEYKIELDLRTPGTDTPLTLIFENSVEVLKLSFINAHLKEFGFVPLDDSIEIVNIRIEVSEKKTMPSNLFQSGSKNKKSKTNQPGHSAHVYFDSINSVEVPVFKQEELVIGDVIHGPALIVEPHSTIVVEPGFDLVLDDSGIVRLTLIEEKTERVETAYDPVLLEVFHHLFMGVAEQMGKLLEKTAHSVNIKERLDFSCAVFDRHGQLIANAQHIPVHIGAMSETVRNIIESNSDDMREGDFYCSNDPYSGGSHLPDITVVAPVFRKGKQMFYLAARGHHADVGGIAKGSMFPFATKLEEEGVVIKNLLIVRDNKFLKEILSRVLTSGLYPARNLPERLADIRAQVAAVNRGIIEMQNLCEKYSDDVVNAYMGHIRDDARYAMEKVLGDLLNNNQSKTYEFADYLDCGAAIRVRIKLFRNEHGKVQAIVDFTVTDSELQSSLNAPPAVTRAAVLYVFRTLINRPIPLNDGCLDPVTIIIPPRSLLNPSSGLAVSGGNVETSQRIVDVLFGALGIAAASQGTMNNVLFGTLDGKSQYYETIAGGSGAIEGFNGASAVQVHMTNTRITDPEVIETRFPSVRLEKFLIRRGSGGQGRWRGGDGVIRSYRFLEPMEISILSERRINHPFGLKGGKDGATGENILIKKDGATIRLNGHFHAIIDAGDILEIRTPGGGGFG